MSFLKVKRKIVDDPKEIFVLASKKCKLLNDTDEIPVFELTNSCVPCENVHGVIEDKINKSRAGIKSRTFDYEKLKAKLRAENVEIARERKLKVLNHVRKLDSSDEESVQVINLSDDDEDTETDENGNKYVYDLYYSSKCVRLPDPESINDYCLREMDDDLYAKEEPEAEELNEQDDDVDEDSNDENYWKNDYPESYGSVSSEEESDSDDDYLSRKMRKTRLNSDYSLSSDEFDEDVHHKLFVSKLNKSSKSDSDEYFDEVTGSESEQSD